jgi:hypothetical protein
MSTSLDVHRELLITLKQEGQTYQTMMAFLLELTVLLANAACGGILQISASLTHLPLLHLNLSTKSRIFSFINGFQTLKRAEVGSAFLKHPTRRRSGLLDHMLL